MDREAGLAHNRKKRKFGMDNTATADPPPTNPYLPDNADSDTTEFHQYADNLIREAQDDNSVPEDAIPPLTIPTSTSGEPQTPHAPRQQCTTPASSSSSRKTQILLAKLFNYALSPEDGLEFYWPGSKKNLEVDLVAHELAAAEESSDCIQVDTQTSVDYKALNMEKSAAVLAKSHDPSDRVRPKSLSLTPKSANPGLTGHDLGH